VLLVAVKTAVTWWQACVLRDGRGESSPDPQEHATLVSGVRSALRPDPALCLWCQSVGCVVVTAVVSSPPRVCLVPVILSFPRIFSMWRRSQRRSSRWDSCGIPLALPTARHPGRPLDGTGTCVIGAVPGMSCRSPRRRLAGCHTCPPWATAEVLVHSSVRIWGCTYHPHGVTSLFRVPRTAAQGTPRRQHRCSIETRDPATPGLMRPGGRRCRLSAPTDYHGCKGPGTVYPGSPGDMPRRSRVHASGATRNSPTHVMIIQRS
jgi:hypothetical protein